ncbi:MAG: glutamate racemase [Proteobacteria bacterium]|nr:glutamate racemase [Pseudomonadota bacterium]MCP4921922.1 glutamate racemase [Pseudomonadota bacterium]
MDRPIGVFDSGVGGLTVLRALAHELPDEDLLYLGDTARVPYGTRSPETVIKYAQRVAAHMWSSGIKALVVACNTATAHALPTLQASGEALGIPVVGVVEPGVEAATKATVTGRVAVAGTEGTIRSRRYQDALERRGLEPVGVACPLFVSLAEEGWTDGEVPRLVAEAYLGGLREGPDTLILGCTHYPLLTSAIASVLPDVRLVDSASATAQVVARELEARGLIAESPGGTTRFLVTDNLDRFVRVGERFLGQRPEHVELVDLPAPHGPFAGTPS